MYTYIYVFSSSSSLFVKIFSSFLLNQIYQFFVCGKSSILRLSREFQLCYRIVVSKFSSKKSFEVLLFVLFIIHTLSAALHRGSAEALWSFSGPSLDSFSIGPCSYVGDTRAECNSPCEVSQEWSRRGE